MIFDETEQAQVPLSSPVSPARCRASSPFPAESQRVAIGGAALPVPFVGRLALSEPEQHGHAGRRRPAVDPAAAQAWVAVKMGNGAARSPSAYDAIQLDNASHANHTSPVQ